MVKVTVRGLGVGAAGASGLLGVAGCASGALPPGDDGAATAQASAYTIADPGSASLELGWQYAATGERYAFFLRRSTTDEFVRAGETLSFTVPIYVAWYALYPEQGVPDVARMKELTVEARVSFQRAGAEVSSTAVRVTSFSGGDAYDLSGATASFVVPTGVDALRVELAFGDALDATKSATLGARDTASVPVFGGALPAKTALFDTYYTSPRQRVVEGGGPVAGGEVTLAYTDWRADGLVDKMMIDRQIGQTTGYGRFGAYTYALLGEVEHEISYGVAFDDGSGWHAEAPLLPRADSPIVGAGRTAYEGTLPVPATATRMWTYFHVKTYLVADYTRWPNATDRRYRQGERVLVRERWDNPRGPFTNHELAVEAR